MNADDYQPGRHLCEICGEEHGERFDCQNPPRPPLATPTPEDQRCAVANIREGRSAFPAGAKCYVLHMAGMGMDSVRVWLRSRGGRGIFIYVRCNNLVTPRVKFCPEHLRGEFWGYHGRTPEEVVQIIAATPPPKIP